MKAMALSTADQSSRFARAIVGDVMHPHVLTCAPGTPLVTVAQRMASEGVHAIIILPADDRSLWGVVSDTDLLQHAKCVDELTAGDVASRDVVEVFPEDRVESAARRMARHAVTHALVLDRPTGFPIGLLSALDVARVLAPGGGD